MTRYYNCIVVLRDGVRIKYRNVTNEQRFLSYCKNKLPVRAVYFYCKRHYRDQVGSYCGFWSLKKGLNLH